MITTDSYESMASNNFTCNGIEQLLSEQENLGLQLGQLLLNSIPRTGLYTGELSHEFPGFVQHLRGVLSRSPRTILRQAIESVDTESLDEEALREIRATLQLDSDTSLYTIGETVDTLMKGNLHLRLEATRRRLDKGINHNEEEMNKIVSQVLSRNQKISDPPINIANLVNQIRIKQNQRRNNLQNHLLCLEKELENDPQYQRYSFIMRLWKECGGEHIWNNYKAVEDTICHNRNIRGLKFESKACDYAFSMIVKQLCNDKDENYGNYSYIRGAHWWCDKHNVGEIDLVIYHQYRGVVVAICEMKSVAFEIPIASRQHDAKLDAASRVETKNRWKIGKTYDGAMQISGHTSLFVVTVLLPPCHTSKINYPIGVEPLVVKAICQGIRSQGKRIVHHSSLDLCQPLVTMLSGSDDVSIDKAIHYVENVPPCPQSPHEGNDIDWNLLRTFVLEYVGMESLRESPLDWFRRFPRERLLVLPRNLIFDK
jgi:hypothetical protein